MTFTLPNGNYFLTYRYGTRDLAGVAFNKLAVNGTTISPNLDIPSAAGGQYKQFTLQQNVTVTNNQLTFGIWTMNGQGSPVSSLSLTPGSIPLGTTLTLGMKFAAGTQVQ